MAPCNSSKTLSTLTILATNQLFMETLTQQQQESETTMFQTLQRVVQQPRVYNQELFNPPIFFSTFATISTSLLSMLQHLLSPLDLLLYTPHA